MTGRAAIRFVVLAAPRTGSNLLCSLLNAHPEIRCHHGLFNPGGIHCARDALGSLGIDGGIAARDRDPGAFLDLVWASSGKARAIGFKMNRGENHTALDLLLRDPSVRKIVLKRRNRVRTYVSEEIARVTGVWESFDDCRAASIPAVRIDVRCLIRHIDLNAAYYADIATVLGATRQCWLDTDYEALADADELARILGFLGVAPCSRLTAACHKRGPSDLGAVVENFDELAVALRGTVLLDELYGHDAPDLRVLLSS